MKNKTKTQKKLSMDLNGWINDIDHRETVNFNERPIPYHEINLIVIHNISLPPREFNNTDITDFFCNNLDYNKHPFYQTIKNLKVSPHLFIQRDGKIMQFVSFQNRAWHAGVSSYKGMDNCNDFSIGIELQGCDDIAYSDKQYKSLNQAISLLQVSFTKICDNIVAHSFISPDRKTDPGQAFDWKRIKPNNK